MRNVFIDCGAWTGDTVIRFIGCNKNYDIYAFECHPDHKDELIKLSEEYNFTFINKAVWINEGPILFYLGTGNRTSASTLYKTKKKKIDKENPIIVECIDFSKWIKDNFATDDNIVCKMNIEGAEYKLLPKMIADGTMKYIKKLYVSWHYNKLEGFDKRTHDSLVRNLSLITKLHKWDYDGKNNPFKGTI